MGKVANIGKEMTRLGGLLSGQMTKLECLVGKKIFCVKVCLNEDTRRL